MGNVIEFKNVTKEYVTGDHVLKAVDGVNFSIKNGEFVVILGPSGAGKSTLLNLLGGLDSPNSGDIIVDGINIVNFDDNELSDYRAKSVGFIFQFYNLIPTLNVLENVQLIDELVENPLNCEEILESVGLKDHLSQFPSELSGGEQQRVSIARALSKNPFMLLCDEPTGALDSKTGTTILSLLQNMSIKEDTTVIIVTHNKILAKAANRVLMIKNGKIEKVILNDKPLKVEDLDL